MTTIIILISIPVVFFAGWFFGSRFALRNDPIAAAPLVADEELSDELIAVIAAAAAEILIASIVVRRIQFLNDASTGAWATTGRLNIMASHQISKRNT